MLNPDGVIVGNYRTGLFGLDFNRQFKDELNKQPILLSFIKLARDLKENLLAYIDLHGHSIKRNSFTYGPEFNMNEVRKFSF